MWAHARFVTQVIDESIKIKTHAFLCNSLIILFFNNFFWDADAFQNLIKYVFLEIIQKEEFWIL